MPTLIDLSITKLAPLQAAHSDFSELPSSLKPGHKALRKCVNNITQCDKGTVLLISSAP